MKGRDIYADLENIEERGKRKKDKKGSSLFGKKDESETTEPAPKNMEQPKPSPQQPAQKPVASQSQKLMEIKQQDGSQAVHKTQATESQQRVESDSPKKEVKGPAPSASVGGKPKTSVPGRPPEKRPGVPTQERLTDEEMEPLEPMGGQEDYKGRDIYADLQKIEERGSKKKQPAPVSKSFWGKKEPEKVQKEKPAQPQQQAEFDVCRACGASLASRASECEICGAKVMDMDVAELQPAPSRPLLPERAQEVEEEEQDLVEKPRPKTVQSAEREKPAVEKVAAAQQAEQPLPESTTFSEPAQEWKPLEGRERKRAEEALHEFKKKLDKAFKSGTLTREQCLAKVKEKETELGLGPPTA